MRRNPEDQPKINLSLIFLAMLVQNSSNKNTISPTQIMGARLQKMNCKQRVPSWPFSPKSNHHGSEPRNRNHRGYKS